MSRQGNRLRRLSELTDTHLGRTVTIGDLTGTLTGVIPVADRVQLALVIGGARLFTDAYPADAHIEVHTKQATA